jgi:hypothetical protein
MGEDTTEQDLEFVERMLGKTGLLQGIGHLIEGFRLQAEALSEETNMSYEQSVEVLTGPAVMESLARHVRKELLGEEGMNNPIDKP